MFKLPFNQYRKLSAILLLQLLFAAPLMAGQIMIENLRLAKNEGHTRIVLELSAEVAHSVFTLSAPERVVLDIKNTAFKIRPSQSAIATSDLITNLRSAARNGSDLRIVLDLKQRARAKTFILKPENDIGYRLVLDLYPASIQQMAKNQVGSALATSSKPQPGANRASKSAKTDKAKSTATSDKKLRDVIIAIDAGHGGRDPGAIGHNRTLEKNITLSIARRLAKKIDAQQGMRAVMIRKGDYFIPLRRRIVIAREQKADMFISIHADAYTDKRARGSSVYALSVNGASSEAARWLADRENAADLMGGIALDDKNDLLASVLLDLSQTATIQSSLEVGEAILGHMGRVKKLHKSKVQQAGFLVLKSPDIPSVLVETAFITNPKEEKLLKQADHQERLAQAITLGVRRYFYKKAPPDTWLAEQNIKKNESQLALNE